MRVYFAPCGKGLGHVGRCIPIAKKLEEKNDAELVFSTYQEGVRYVEREHFPLIKAPPIDFQVKPDGTIDFRRTAIHPGPFLASYTLMKQVNAEIEAMERFKPDVVVSDSRASSLMAAKFLRIPRICILNQFNVIIPRETHFLRLARLADSITLTIVGKIWTSGDVVLIPDFPPPYTVSTRNLNIPRSYREKVKLIGPILAVHPHRLPSKRELRRKLELPIDKLVIFAPISGPIKEKRFLTGLLKRILRHFPDRFEVVLSLGYPKSDADPLYYDNLRIYKWIPNRFEYLKACDLVISRAGHGTLTQCMAYGKPMILIPTPGHTEQINNAVKLKKLGMAEVIPQEKLTEERLLEKIQEIFENNLAAKLEKAQSRVLEYSGIDKAVETITKTAKEG